MKKQCKYLIIKNYEISGQKSKKELREFQVTNDA